MSNIQITPSSGGGGTTVYDAVVAPSGGDYETVQEAITAGASGANLLAAGTGTTKHKIFYCLLSVDTAGTVTLADGLGTYYMTAGETIPIDFRPLGLEQTTADTAITVTNGGGGNFSASLTYSTS